MRSHMVYSPATGSWLRLMALTVGHTHTTHTRRNWQLRGMLSFSTGATEVCQNETALLRWALMSPPQSWQYLGLPVSYTFKKKKKRKRLWALLFRFCCLTKLQFLAIQLTPILFHAHRNEISYRFAFIYTFSCVKSPFTTVLYPQMFIGMCTGSQTEMHWLTKPHLGP